MSTKPRTLREMISQFCAEQGLGENTGIEVVKTLRPNIAKLFASPVDKVTQVPQPQFLDWAEVSLNSMTQPAFEITLQGKPDQTLVICRDLNDGDGTEDPVMDLVFRHELDNALETDDDMISPTPDRPEVLDWQAHEAREWPVE